jgi:peptide-methionine (S)-S-oxide reductase
LTAANVFKQRIVTKVAPLQAFYRAEDYHQDYVLHCQQNSPLCSNKRYVVYNDLPKLTNLHAEFPELLKGGKQ